MKTFELVAPCHFGLEAVTKREIYDLGYEIARVEETMERISSHYGATQSNFFVLSNGIFTTGNAGGSERYANVEYIPLKGAQMEKIAEINQLSRDIAADKYTLREARLKVEEIPAISCSYSAIVRRSKAAERDIRRPAP